MDTEWVIETQLLSTKCPFLDEEWCTHEQCNDFCNEEYCPIKVDIPIK